MALVIVSFGGPFRRILSITNDWSCNRCRYHQSYIFVVSFCLFNFYYYFLNYITLLIPSLNFNNTPITSWPYQITTIFDYLLSVFEIINLNSLIFSSKCKPCTHALSFRTQSFQKFKECRPTIWYNIGNLIL